jgi:hypothetical protein
MNRLALIVMVAAAGCERAPPDAALLRCQAQAEACGAALVAKDFEKFADLTHPRLVNLLGGRAAMAELLRKQVKESAFEIVALKVDVPERIIVAGPDVIAVVPVTRTTLDGGKKTEGRSFFLGVSSDQGKTWTFLDGTHLDNRLLKLVLPHFPSGVRLP